MSAIDPGDVLARYTVHDRSAPHLRVNFISSLDGAATHDGLSGGLGDDADRLVFDTVRMLTDVILVGAGTVRAEGYGGIRFTDEAVAWRVAHALPEHPPVALVSGRLDLDPAHPVFTAAATRPIVITHAQAPAQRRAALAAVADVWVCGEASVDHALMVRTLTARGYPQVLCEGGPSLFGSLLAADAVDELCLTLAPLLESGRAARIAGAPDASPRRMRLAHALPAGDTLLLRYLRAREL
ncbi:riboflavin biosynthesis pyrimidine reductase [Cryobacterium sp. MP_3.1]|uniref:Pyrimidine reductase family protein n=1 Tax=Cryobacterium zongtaii TaxID=1259217 RepID=A0A2S3ZFP4_9MICO|nr:MULTISPECIES: pyrimidine reductase family protein [Cryobacterium]MEC5184077.1 riboflavin biosynthesis pyrimidine reductase [Cryobacterium sp. MP_3.1]POH65918.1 pyrimidine reductase family protein [Cryobacterium zongtaii]